MCLHLRRRASKSGQVQEGGSFSISTAYFLTLVWLRTIQRLSTRVIWELRAICSPLASRASTLHLAFSARRAHNVGGSATACTIMLWSNRSRWLLQQPVRPFLL